MRNRSVALCVLAFQALVTASPLAAWAGTDAHPLVLRGLDPVSLTEGHEVPGLPAWKTEYGAFTYSFSSNEHRLQFLGDPTRYSVQGDGKCLHMREMAGKPDIFKVVDRKIYLVGDPACLKALAENAEAYAQAFKSPQKKVAVLIFPGVQIIDYTGPWEVFGEAGYEVFSVAATADPIVTNMGMTVIPRYTFANSPKADIVVLPGGSVPTRTPATDPIVQWVQSQARQTEITFSVCNGAFWLANAGLLDGKRATTTTNGNLEALATNFPKVSVVSDERFVDVGRIITAAGLSSGIDGALHVVERIDGHTRAQLVALGMEYDWRPDVGFARGALADRYIRRLGRALPQDARINVSDLKGDRDHWEQSWNVANTKLDARGLAQIVDQACAKFWVKTGQKTEPTREGRSWSFKGVDGRAWTASTVVEPAGAAGEFKVTFSLKQSDRS